MLETNWWSPQILFGQLLRYGLSGIVINLSLYFTYLVLVGFGSLPVIASTIVFCIGVPISLSTHRHFTFQSDQISKVRKAIFILSYIFGYLTQIGILSILHYDLGFTHQISQAIAICVVALVIFIVQKQIVFKR